MTQMISEKEARQKWCPFARPAPYGEAAALRSQPSYTRTAHGDPSAGSLCMGTACMAWESAGNESILGENETPKGRCGLANRR